MKKYQIPTIEFVKFDENDVICTSEGSMVVSDKETQSQYGKDRSTIWDD